MNRIEAAKVVAYLNRAGLVGAMEGQAAVWADALHDVAYQDAQQVVRDMVRARTSRERWVTPGDVIAGIREARRWGVLESDRARRAQQIDPPGGLTADQERAWRAEYHEAVIGGAYPDVAASLATQGLRALAPPDPSDAR
ncbi:hypothetical protein EDD28_2417 [Salana multivorans]|uniref:Uncharacterized protein n=1 Tax=Salana multivorans TaxID=120377 RepID=A0A3N2DDS6_9MICO|nr:hypothetical protein [Salana multivorans]ROR97808.1 hypothetical protein EDD28_2417 [Salana multivorans]